MSIFDAFGDRWQSGDDVVATSDVGSGIFGASVPEGTRGRVREYHSGLVSDEVEVEFDGGRTEFVRPSELRRHSWY